MTLANRLKPRLRRIRAIPGQFGLRPHRVFLVKRTGATEHGNNPYRDEVEVVEGNSQPPKVEQLGDEALALGGLAQGSLRIGPITAPDDDDAATGPLFRGTDLETYETLAVRVSGPIGNWIYTIKSRKMDKAMHWILTVEPLSEVSE
jgi:hypothetical protein